MFQNIAYFNCNYNQISDTVTTSCIRSRTAWHDRLDATILMPRKSWCWVCLGARDILMPKCIK